VTYPRKLLAVALAVVILTASATAAQEPDPGATQQQRDDVRARQAQVVLQVDALGAKDAEVRAALTQIERNVATQRSELRQAEQAQARANAALDGATHAVADAQRSLDELNVNADQLVVDSFVNPPSDNALEPLRAGSVSEAAVMQAILEMQGDRDARLLEQLAQAHDALEAEEANKQDAAAEAEEARQGAAQELVDVEAALAQQQEFAAQVEERLNAKLAESESLKALDAALSDKLAQEQAALAAQLAAARAAQAAPPPADVAPSEITTVPGGLATVTCPTGGTITVAGSISGNVQALLDAAGADGVPLCGGGYRDPEEQIELRMANCGTSYYAIYEMPASECDPPTAQPGTSLHEQGLAIDFTCDGSIVSSGDVCWHWLQANAATYGLYNLASEPWHWSIDGS
jgi:LAS superfamily LD-carboxypeptidase LdcB